MIQINVTGYLGGDAEVKQTKDGGSFYSFRLGSSMGKDKQTGEDKTSWVNCTMHQPPKADFLMKKGALLHVAGIYYGSYTSEKGDVSLQIRAKDFQVLKSAREQTTDDKRSDARVARQEEHNKNIGLDKSPWDDNGFV